MTYFWSIEWVDKGKKVGPHWLSRSTTVEMSLERAKVYLGRDVLESNSSMDDRIRVKIYTNPRTEEYETLFDGTVREFGSLQFSEPYKLPIRYSKTLQPELPLEQTTSSPTKPVLPKHFQPREKEKPTPRQIRYIAILSHKLGMKEPYVATYGEAGRMISELKRELKYRKEQ